MSRYLTWDGFRLFRSVKAAAKACLAEDLNPFDLLVLVGGRTQLADDWEVDELLREAYDCTMADIWRI